MQHLVKGNRTKIILLFILLPLGFSFKADRFVLHKRIYVQGNYFTTDNLGNCFIVDKDEITKYDGNGAVFNKFSIKAFGNVESIDATNPMKLMVFYKDFSKIVYLDNTLSLNGNPIDLEDYNLTQSKLICVSHSDGIWFYDQQKFEIIRLDKNLNPSQNTSNLNQLLGIELSPNFMCEYNNSVYLNNPATGILVFDIFGTYIKTIPLLNLSKFQVSNDAIYFIHNNKAISYNLKTLEQVEIKLSDMKYTDIRIQKDMFFVKNEELIDMLKLE
jgi:hypothetical protein